MKGKSYRGKLKVLALMLCLLNLSSCSLDDETAEDVIDTSRHLQEESFEAGSLEDLFVKKANKCIAGDLSEIDSLIADYRASFRDRTSSNSLIYQQYTLNRYFEKCAFKALQLQNSKVFEAMLSRPNQCARISQRFYEMGNLSDGAFWLQRVINVQGQAQGYTSAGKIFIMHPKSLSMGAKLLQEGARLGNSEARDTLLSLTRPSTQIYQDVVDTLREDYIQKLKAQGKLPKD